MEQMYGDIRLQKAFSIAIKTNKITPLLKEELRLSILTKRLAEGKDEMEVKFDRPKKYELTDDELLKRDRRRLQNREAARKFRQNKKSKASSLLETVEKQEVLKKELEQLIEELTAEKNNLLTEIQDLIYINPCATSENDLHEYQTDVALKNMSTVEHHSQESKPHQVYEYPHSNLADTRVLEVRNITQDPELSPTSSVDHSTLRVDMDRPQLTGYGIINDNDLVTIQMSDIDMS